MNGDIVQPSTAIFTSLRSAAILKTFSAALHVPLRPVICSMRLVSSAACALSGHTVSTTNDFLSGIGNHPCARKRFSLCFLHIQARFAGNIWSTTHNASVLLSQASLKAAIGQSNQMFGDLATFAVTE